jgi:tetratricopeptide (TPR) repeat protein
MVTVSVGLKIINCQHTTRKTLMCSIMKHSLSILMVCIPAFICCVTFAQEILVPSASTSLIGDSIDVNQLQKIINEHPGERISAQAQNILAIRAYSQHQDDIAEPSFALTRNQYLNTPEGATASCYLGRIAYRKDHFSESIPYLREYLQTNPVGVDAQWARYCMARSMRRTEDTGFIAAVQSYFANPHDSLAAKDFNVQYDLVRFLADNQGQYSQAISEANKYFNLYPDSKYVRDLEPRVIDYYLLNHDAQNAKKLCLSLINKYPPNTPDAARVQYMLGSIFSDSKDFDRARLEYAKVAQLHPDATRWVSAASYALAFLDVWEGRLKNDSSLLASAKAKLQGFVNNHPSDRHVPGALMGLADFYLKATQFTEAVDAYSRIISFDTTLIDTGKKARWSNDMKNHRGLVTQAHVAKGMLLRIHLNDAQGALSEFESVLKNNPDSADMLLNKALCLVDIGKPEEAKLILKKLVSEETSLKDVATQILSTF